MSTLRRSLLFLLVSLVWMIPASAQDVTSPDLPPSVGVVDETLVYFDGADSRVIFEFPEGSWLYTNSLQWYGEDQITFRLLPDSATQWFVDLQGNVEQLQLMQPLFDLPVTFSDDLQTVYYATEDGSSYFLPSQRYLPVIAQDMNSDEQRVVGAVLHGDGCGGGYGNPMQLIYDQESGYGGSQVFFDLIDRGILYTASCTGNGISLLPLPDAGSENFPFSLDNLSHIALSPDGTKIAGRTSLINEPYPAFVVDLESRTSVYLLTAELYVDQFGFGADGSLYFSTKKPVGDLVLNSGYTQDGIEKIELALYPGIAQGYARDESYPIVPAYEVGVYRYDLQTSEIEELITFDDAYGVARLFELDGQMVASVIPSGRAWLDAILDGTLDAETAVMMGDAFVQPAIVQLTGVDDFPVLVAGVTRLTPRQ